MSIGMIAIHGSDGEVMAPLGKRGTFYRGKQLQVRIIARSTDEDVPIGVREALVGLQVPIIFMSDQLAGQGVNLGLSSRTVIAYASEVVLILEGVGMLDEAEALRQVAGNELDMLTFESGVYEFVDG